MDNMTFFTSYKYLILIISILLVSATLRPTLVSANTSLDIGNSSEKKELPFFSANYDALIQGFPVTAKREYKPISDSISELSFTANSLVASLSETSQFTWQQEQIKPLRFTHNRTIFGQSRRKTLSFDWSKKKITSTNKGKTKVIDNPQEALDHLSFQLQLQHDLSANKIHNKVYRIADKKKIKEYTFKIIGEERIQTALGELDTTKVMVNRDNNKRITYIWLAKDWNNLLAKLEQYEEKDKKFSIQVTHAIIDGKIVSGL